ncbi:MAG: hypothetical protein LBQ74_13945 [Prevotella sp.]|jgi:hypothetical protein|nr:hypothetical protein [Prevotella sp.]
MITEELYSTILKYVKKRSLKILGFTKGVDIYDIAHDVIADAEFSISKWRLLVDRRIYDKAAEHGIKKIPIDKIHFKDREIEEKWICKKCQQDFPKSMFRLSFCLCDNCYRIVHRDRILANNRRWLNKPVNREKKRVYCIAWKMHNKEEVSEYNKKYKAAHKEEVSNYNKEYKKKNREKIREYNREYYHKTKKINENNNS